MKYYFEVFRKYADFSGRARRSEYWFFTLFNTLIYFFLAFVSSAFQVRSGAFLLIPLSYLLAVIVPSLAVCVRRLHDSGKSGTYIFLGFIPFVGGLIVLVFTLMDGDAGINKYGPDPKERLVKSQIADFGQKVEESNFE